MWVGSAGIIEVLAGVALVDATPALRTPGEMDAARVLFLIGSRTATTREQIADFGQCAIVETLDAGAVALVAIGGETQSDERLVRTAFITATAPLLRDRTGLTVVLSGGAIARTFCDGVGTVGLEPFDEVGAATPRSRAIGAPLWIVTKSGGFGTLHAYREVLASMRERMTA